MILLRATLLSMTASLCLSACGGADTAPGDAPDAAMTGTSGEAGAAQGSIPTLAEGPDVCFRAIAKHLGADAKVSEITSFFSVGKEIDPSDGKPAGEMTSCSVQYQNPDDPRKLLNTRLDLNSGQFSPPSPVEITVMGGNAADFRLDDYLIPLSQVDAAALSSVMAAQKGRLSSVYGNYAWSGVRLSAPGPFNNRHTLRLDLTGRLAANDIKETGYASVSTDGKTITADHLMP
mgnify:CR=1 FL=1